MPEERERATASEAHFVSQVLLKEKKQRGIELKMKMDMKIQKKSERVIKDDDDDDDIDRLSDLPDHLLLHIMEFSNIIDAIRTCVLSKRWKDLWKRLTILKLYNSNPNRNDYFNNFVSKVLFRRDGSIPLHNLVFEHYGPLDPHKATLLRIMKYAASHKVQKLVINVELSDICDLELPPSLFRCRSLTFLKLALVNPGGTNRTKFPKSLNLPALKTLHLLRLTFTTSDNGCVEPFSTCNMLNTLIINCCYLPDDAQALCISNSRVSSLTLASSSPYKVVLCTPNLSSLNIMGCLTFQATNLPFLEEADIYYHLPYEGFFLLSWLHLLANVKIMILSLRTLDEIVRVLLNTTQPPCFVRLKSLKVYLGSNSTISDEQVSKMVTNLLQNSPSTKVDIFRDDAFFLIFGKFHYMFTIN